MSRVIKVYAKDYNNAEGEVKYFCCLKNAKRYFKELFNKYKPELVSKYICSSETGPVIWQWSNKKPVGRYKECELEIGSEYTLSGIECLRIILEEIKICDKTVDEPVSEAEIRIFDHSNDKVAYKNLTPGEFKNITRNLNLTWH